MNWSALILFTISVAGAFILISNMGLGRGPGKKKDEEPHQDEG